jgi:hypothetical protein
MPTGPSGIAPFGIQGTMANFLWTMILLGCCAQAQVAAPTTSLATSAVTSGDAGPQPMAVGTDSPSASRPGGKVGLVRGVLKRLDPIHDQLLIRSFGGGDIRIAFDPRTQLLSDNSRTGLTSIPAGSVVSVDTVIDNGKLFARAVRTGSSESVELNGQVVAYDPDKSRLTLRDPVSPEERVSLHITPGTTVINRGQPASPQALSSGMLVQVWFSPTQHAAKRVEILATPGNLFSFSGRIVAVDLRSRVLALSNDSDQSVRELAIGGLNSNSLGFLREGANVNIQAEFDGDRYNVRSVTLVSPNP